MRRLITPKQYAWLSNSIANLSITKILLYLLIVTLWVTVFYGIYDWYRVQSLPLFLGLFYSLL